MSVFNSCWWAHPEAKAAEKEGDDEVCLLDASLDDASVKGVATGVQDKRIGAEYVAALHQLLDAKQAYNVEKDEKVADEDADATTDDCAKPTEGAEKTADDSRKPQTSLVWVTEDFEIPSNEELFSDLGIWW